MKIITSNYDYELQSGNQKAALTNKLIEAFWKAGGLVAKNNEDYYNINRALGAVVDSMVSELNVELRLDHMMMDSIKSDEVGYVKSRLASGMVKSVMEHENFFIGKRSTNQGTTRYLLSVPFILPHLRSVDTSIGE